MATPRYQLQLRVFEQPHRNPANMEEVEANRKPVVLSDLAKVIEGRNPDVVLKNTKAYLEAEGRLIRSVSLGPDGVTAVVYKEGEVKDPLTMKESRKAGGY